MASRSPEQEIQIFTETDADKWEPCGWDLDVLEARKASNFIVFVSFRLRELSQYKHHFPRDFWELAGSFVSGSFHCSYAYARSKTLPLFSWATFQVKYAVDAAAYFWQQPSILVEQQPGSGRQIVFLVDFILPAGQKEFLRTIPRRAIRDCNHFVWHVAFTEHIIRCYRNSFERLKDSVRRVEIQNQNASAALPPDFRALHEISRHIIHLNETIASAEHTIQCMLDEQLRWRGEDPDTVATVKQNWLDVHSQLLFQLKWIHSLKMRSRSLSERHANQINLGYNLVSQAFGRDARTDSAMMKTVAVVSLVYLPGTFVSGIFGTNFFSFQADDHNGWSTSPTFWLYWAVTVPLTLTTILAWVLWHFRKRWLRRSPESVLDSSIYNFHVSDNRVNPS
ncbi:hypothetical protein BJY04DRAFT_152298 [Aspergillus karnatakaensis]|uniref:uncharacterized protein n=1 Tax=Aspergillus karnatakaensis TaxID=1810916 RepID=UPI003CCCCBCB